MLLVVSSVCYSVVSKRYVSNRRVKEVIREIGLFKALHPDICLRIELLRDTTCQAVQLHTVQPAVIVHALRHTAEEIAHAHCRLQHVSSIEPEVIKRLVHRADYFRRGVVRVQGAFRCCLVFIIGEQFAELLVFLAPLLVCLVECLRHTAPANVLCKYFLFFRSCTSAFALDCFQGGYCCYVVLELGFQTACSYIRFICYVETVVFLRGVYAFFSLRSEFFRQLGVSSLFQLLGNVFIPEPVEKINYAAIAIADVLTFAVRCAIWHIYGKMSFGISLVVNFQLTFFPRFVKLINIAAKRFKLLLTFGYPIFIFAFHDRIEFKCGIGLSLLKRKTLAPIASYGREFLLRLFCEYVVFIVPVRKRKVCAVIVAAIVELLKAEYAVKSYLAFGFVYQLHCAGI